MLIEIIGGEEKKQQQQMNKDLQKFSFGRSGFENVRDGDGRVSVGEVGVVPTAGDRDAEAVARNSLKNNIVVLPDYPLATLKEKKMLQVSA